MDKEPHSKAKSPLVFYQSEHLSTCAKRLIHAFTGKPLSMGGQALDVETRLNNRKIMAEALGIPAKTLVVPSQVHSDISKSHLEEDLEHCDALIVTKPNHPAMVLAADCVPILLYARDKHVGAAIHAGWRGTAQSIAAKTAQRLKDEFGCSLPEMIAAIGPCIGGCCYEVSDEVVEALKSTVPNDIASDWVDMATGKPKVDLKTVNRLQLEALDIREIDVLPHCTQCDPENFFSHRRGEIGRQGAVLMLK